MLKQSKKEKVERMQKLSTNDKKHRTIYITSSIEEKRRQIIKE